MVEAARPVGERGLDGLGVVRRGQGEDALVGREPVELVQEFPEEDVPAAPPAARIQIQVFQEQDRRLELPSEGEQSLELRRALDLPGTHPEERGRHGTAEHLPQEGLAGARGTHEENPPPDRQPERLVAGEPRHELEDVAVDLRPGARSQHDVLPGVGPVQRQELPLGIQLRPPQVGVGIHPGLDPVQQVPQERRLLGGADEGEAGHLLAPLMVETDPGHHPFPGGALVAHPGVVQRCAPRPGAARDHDGGQGEFPRLLAPEAHGQTLCPAREAGGEGLLQQVVPVARVVPVEAAEPPGGPPEERLGRDLAGAVTVLPPVIGLEDLQEPRPAVPVGMGIESQRQGSVHLCV